MVWDSGKVRRFAYCCGEHQAGYMLCKLFWLIFSRTVSVLVEDSDGRWSREIIVDCSDRCCVCREPNSGMAKLVLYGARGALFQLHLSDDARDLELGDLDFIDETDRAVVTGYNRDDCISTWRLRDWLETQRAALIEAGTAVPRLEAAEGAPRDAGL